MRGLAGFVIFAEILVALALTIGNTGTFSNTAAVLPGVLGNLTNVERSSAHLAILTENPELDRVATLKAQDMAQKSYFSHTSPEGLTPWYWFDQVGYDYEYAGENLAIDFTDSHDVTNAWMNSPTHRANIIKAAYTEIGTGVASGTFEGVETVFVAQVYAKPATKVAVAEVPVVEPAVPVMEKVAVAEIAPEPVSEVATTVLALAPGEPQVLGAVTDSTEVSKPTPQATFWQKILLSPRHTANLAFGIIALWVLIALCIHIFVKKDSRHVDLILNGLVLVALIIAVSIVNKVLVNKTQTSFQAFDANGAVTLEK
jgi:hypothetical protein